MKLRRLKTMTEDRFRVDMTDGERLELIAALDEAVSGAPRNDGRGPGWASMRRALSLPLKNEEPRPADAVPGSIAEGSHLPPPVARIDDEDTTEARIVTEREAEEILGELRQHRAFRAVVLHELGIKPPYPPDLIAEVMVYIRGLGHTTRLLSVEVGRLTEKVAVLELER